MQHNAFLLSLECIDLLETKDSKYNKEELLLEFYSLLQDFFGEEHLDPFDVFTFYLTSDYKKYTPLEPNTHIILLLNDGRVIAGLVFEYYVLSNTGLLAYLYVKDEYRNKGLSSFLVNKSLEILKEENALRNRHLQEILHHPNFEKCNLLPQLMQLLNLENGLEALQNALLQLQLVFVVECEEASMDEIRRANDNRHHKEMNPLIRHYIYFHMGFRFLPFKFIQPPLSEHTSPAEDLLLLAHSSFHHGVEKGEMYICGDSIRLFCWEYTTSCLPSFTKNEKYLNQLKGISEKVILKDLPWKK